MEDEDIVHALKKFKEHMNKARVGEPARGIFQIEQRPSQLFVEPRLIVSIFCASHERRMDNGCIILKFNLTSGKTGLRESDIGHQVSDFFFPTSGFRSLISEVERNKIKNSKTKTIRLRRMVFVVHVLAYNGSRFENNKGGMCANKY